MSSPIRQFVHKPIQAQKRNPRQRSRDPFQFTHRSQRLHHFHRHHQLGFERRKYSRRLTLSPQHPIVHARERIFDRASESRGKVLKSHGVFQFQFAAFPIRQKCLKLLIKCRAVIVMIEMTKFMSHHIFNTLPGSSY